MCIIVVVENGKELPDENILRKCWDNNSHGAGFMYNDGDTVNIRKGFMTFEDFMLSLKVSRGIYTEKELQDMSFVLHFRIKTSGTVNAACCHPFPLDDDVNHLMETFLSTDVGIAHNGVIQGMETSLTVSDTMSYIMEFLIPLKKAIPDFQHNETALKMVDVTITGSRMAFLTPDGIVTRVGKWYTEDGIHYSNETYKVDRITYSSYGNSYDLSGYQSNASYNNYVLPAANVIITPSEMIYEQEIEEFMDSKPTETCSFCDGFIECVRYQNWLCDSLDDMSQKQEEEIKS